MKAKEMGNAARRGGLSSTQLTGRDGATDEGERCPPAARVGDLDPGRDRRTPGEEDEQSDPPPH